MTANELVDQSKASGKAVYAEHTNGVRFELLDRKDFVDYKITREGQLIHHIMGHGWKVILQEPE